MDGSRDQQLGGNVNILNFKINGIILKDTDVSVEDFHMAISMDTSTYQLSDVIYNGISYGVISEIDGAFSLCPDSNNVYNSSQCSQFWTSWLNNRFSEGKVTNGSNQNFVELTFDESISSEKHFLSARSMLGNDRTAKMLASAANAGLITALKGEFKPIRGKERLIFSFDESVFLLQDHVYNLSSIDNRSELYKAKLAQLEKREEA